MKRVYNKESLNRFKEQDTRRVKDMFIKKEVTRLLKSLDKQYKEYEKTLEARGCVEIEHGI